MLLTSMLIWAVTLMWQLIRDIVAILIVIIASRVVVIGSSGICFYTLKIVPRYRDPQL